MAKHSFSIHPGLIAALVLALGGGAVFWGTRDRSPARPLPNATLTEQRAFWRERLRSGNTDADSYANLGKLEEHDGFYLSAHRNLLAARALGGAEETISGALGRALVGLGRYDEAEPELTRAYALAPHDVEAMANLAGIYVLQQNNDKATQLLHDFLVAHPNVKDEATLERLMLCANGIGDKADGKQLAKRLADAAPSNPLGWVIQGQYALSAKQPEAAGFFERAVAAVPQEGSMWYLYGVALEALGDKQGALEKYRKAVALNGRAVDAREKIAKLEAARGNWQAAADGMVWVARASPSFETTNNAALACEKAKRTNDTLYWSAVAAGFQSRFEAALDLATQARNGATTDAQRSRALGAMTEAYRGMKRKKEFLATVEEWTKGGTLPELVDRSEAYGKAQDYNGEMTLLKQVLAGSPQNAAAINRRLAQAAAKRQLPDEQEKYLAEAVRLDPKVAKWHADLADLYFNKRSEGDYLQKAITEYQEAIRLGGDDQEAGTWLRLGLSYSEKGDMAQALYHAEHAVDLEPGYGPAYQELARLYTKIGDKKTSTEMLGFYQKYVLYDQEISTLKTRARAPQASLADIVAYANLLLRSGNTEEAMVWYERGLSIAPKDKTIRQRLAYLYTRLRLPDRAIAQGVAL